MKKILFTLLLCILFSNCNGSSGTDKEINTATQWFALSIRTFIGFFEDNLKNCDGFLNVFNEISQDQVPCDNGDQGFFQVTLGDVSCDNGPPLNATANFTIETQNCQDKDNDVIATGIQNLVLTFSSEGNIGVMSTTAIDVNGFGYSYDNFWTKVDFSDNSLSCSDAGDMTVSMPDEPDQTCDITSSCRGCNLK